MDFDFYLKVFLRRLPILIVLTAIGAAAGLSMALTLPPTYRSEATLIVESEQIPDELAASTVRTGDVEALQIIRQRILSRTALLEMANRLRIYEGVDGAATMSPDARVADIRSRIRINTVGGNRRRSAEATIVSVSFVDARPQIAAAVANEVVTQILQENVRMRTNVATQTLDFFTQEVERLEQSLARVSSQILAFKESNLQSLPDSLDFRRSRQAALQERLLQIEREQTVLRDRRSQLVTLFEATGQTSMGRTGRGETLSPEARNLADLRQQYASLSAVLSEDNPRMALLRNQIAAAETARAAAEGSEAEGAEAESSVSESLFQIEIADIDTQIAYFDQQKDRIEAEMAELTQSIEATPANAISLGSLERDYANLQTRYNQAVANKARAETGNIIESLSKGQRISVIEQAVPPARPFKPNRPAIAMAGLGAGAIAGAVLIAALELLNTAIRRPQDIQGALGIDVFATIPYIRTRQEIWRRRVIIGSVTVLVLVGMPLALWYVDTRVMPLEPLVDRILSRINLA